MIALALMASFSASATDIINKSCTTETNINFNLQVDEKTIAINGVAKSITRDEMDNDPRTLEAYRAWFAGDEDHWKYINVDYFPSTGIVNGYIARPSEHYTHFDCK